MAYVSQTALLDTMYPKTDGFEFQYRVKNKMTDTVNTLRLIWQ